MFDEDSLWTQVWLVQWVRRQAQRGRAETEVRQTWHCTEKAEKREDQLEVKVAG
jgi:hypothetical protein